MKKYEEGLIYMRCVGNAVIVVIRYNWIFFTFNKVRRRCNGDGLEIFLQLRMC